MPRAFQGCQQEPQVPSVCIVCNGARRQSTAASWGGPHIKIGASRELNSGPAAPKAAIIPLDHTPDQTTPFWCALLMQCCIYCRVNHPTQAVLPHAQQHTRRPHACLKASFASAMHSWRAHVAFALSRAHRARKANHQMHTTGS